MNRQISPRDALEGAAQVTPGLNEVEQLERLAREARAKYKLDYQRVRRRGEAWPIPKNPETGKRLKGTGRCPTTGVMSPMLKGVSATTVGSTTAPSPEGRFRTRRERANELRERMAAFTAIYHSAWLVRDSYFGPDERRQRCVKALLATMAEQMRSTDDYEALLFAVADALYASPSGVPWE